MYKYNMTIDGEKYLALFEDHMVAADFIDACVKEDGSKVIVHGFSWETPEQILADYDFGWAYRIECASVSLVPDHQQYKKTTELEEQLRLLGYIR